MPKRKKKESVEQIDYATVAKPHTSMYLMHKYWARKPHNVVSEYIRGYTKEKEIVLDPFCGSGPTPIEAIKLGRKGIGIDLNPISTFVTKMTAIPVDIHQIKKTFEEVENTTAITEAIVRDSNIPHDTIKRLIVIPKEREKLLYRKLEESILKESLSRDNWQFIFYNDLERFYE